MARALFALLAGALVFALFIPVVPGYDQTAYLQGAQALAAGEPLWNEYDGAFVLWPPGYPALVAVGVRAGLAPLASARVVNAVAFAAFIALALALLKHAIAAPSLRAVAAFALIVGPLPATALMSMSEPAFLVLQTALLLRLLTIDDDARAWHWLALGALAGAGVMVRYVGLVGVVVALAVAGRRRWALVALPALLPIALWLLRNFALTGTLIGERGSGARHTLAGNALEMGALLLAWALYFLALAALALAIARWRRRDIDSSPAIRRGALLPCYAALLVAVNVGFGSWSALGADNARLLIGAYVPLLAWTLHAASNAGGHNLLSLTKRKVRHG